MIYVVKEEFRYSCGGSSSGHFMNLDLRFDSRFCSQSVIACPDPQALVVISCKFRHLQLPLTTSVHACQRLMSESECFLAACQSFFSF